MKCNHAPAFKSSPRANAITPKNGVIYWHIQNYTPDMDKGDVLKAFHKAFSEWSLYFKPVVFQPTSNIRLAPIVIRFRKNGDKDLPAPFSKNVLAYAYFPNKKSLGIHSDMYFNENIKWGVKDRYGATNLSAVIVHELGHAFGIEHTKDRQDIMYPIYQGNNKINITSDTVAAVKFLYGKPGELKMLETLKSWFDKQLLKRIVGSLVRRGMDILAGALLVSTLPILTSLGSWFTDNSSDIEVYVIGLVLAGTSFIWSALQKKKDNDTIEGR